MPKKQTTDVKIKMPPKGETKDFLSYYVKPHYNKSRDVEFKDIPKVVEDAAILFNLCFTQNGPYPGGFAVAHPQINDKDPLRFFVTNDRQLIINPVITRHTKTKVENVEGCLSFPDFMPVKTERWNKIEVEYVTLDPATESGFSEKQTASLSGKWSKVYQHEIDHFDAIYIFKLKTIT